MTIENYIKSFSSQATELLRNLPTEEIAKAIHILQAAYERDGRIYVFGNGGSLALATHWVTDFNKTVFSHQLEKPIRRFQAVRVPSSEAELSAWANDVGYDMVFAGPLKNYLRDADVVVAISSSGTSPSIVKAVELAKEHKVPVIGFSGFDGGKLKELADAKIHIETSHGEYELVESVHAAVLHLLIKYFKDYFDHLAEQK
jgi:D-sedoheptulose 7-phosphate isomerase